MNRIVIVFILFLAQTLGVSGQNVVTRNDTSMVIHGTDTLMIPWGSGINSAHISEIDLNLDGLMDLFVFEPNHEYNEATGDKILPFINIGTPGKSNYRYAPQYRSYFPVMETFAFLADYNCDGKMDIFTNTIFQTIKVYRNDSDTALMFTLVKESLETDISKLPPGFGHQPYIYWNQEDFISVSDIDNDGDLDIISVDYIGSFFEYNKNLSKELYGTCDSLVFELKSTCWGRIAEDFLIVVLDTCHINGNVPNPEKVKKSRLHNDKGSKHSSTSILALDLDGDGVKDLLTGDYGSPNLVAYYNGGQTDSSHITSVTSYFPTGDSVHITTFNIPFYVDVDNDGKKDLIVSNRNDVFQDTGSVWLYKNAGTASNPVFTKKTTGFLQDQMIDVGAQSKPVFFDYNKDGLLDLVIGNYGYYQSPGMQFANYQSQLALYENVGSLQDPHFKLISLDFGGLSGINLDTKNNKPTKALHPTFGDLDEDGDEDMLVGDYRGKIHYFENNPVAGKAVFQLVQTNFLDINVNDVNNAQTVNAAPQLFDLNQDGKLDVIVGEMFGHFHYFKNTSTSGVLSFTLEDDTLGDITVTDWLDFTGYGVPFFFKDSLNQVKLLSGSKLGFIQMYDSIIVNGEISNQFRQISQNYQKMWDGIYSSLNGADLNNDKSLDFIMGNNSGGVSLFTSEDSIYIPGISKIKDKDLTWDLYPNPTNHHIVMKINCNCVDQFNYAVYDLMGRQVATKEGLNQIEIQLDHLENGVYILKAENKNRSILITERFIILK